MKKILMATAGALLCTNLVFAADCKVVEYSDHNEVVCEGVPGEYKPELLEETPAPVVIEPAKLKINEGGNNAGSEDVVLTGFSYIELSRGYGYVTYSLKIDVENPGRKAVVYIKAVSKNKSGHQLNFTYLSGLVDHRQKRSLTATTMLPINQAMTFNLFEVGEVRKVY